VSRHVTRTPGRGRSRRRTRGLGRNRRARRLCLGDRRKL